MGKNRILDNDDSQEKNIDKPYEKYDEKYDEKNERNDEKNGNFDDKSGIFDKISWEDLSAEIYLDIKRYTLELGLEIGRDLAITDLDDLIHPAHSLSQNFEPL